MNFKYESSDLVNLKENPEQIFYVIGCKAGVVNTYDIRDIDDVTTTLTDQKESDLMECKEKVEFTVTVKGHFPEKFVDSGLGKKYVDVKMNFGTITVIGTKKDFDKWYKETIETMHAHHDFKVIGINYNSIKKEAPSVKK